jgi:hypothetical protein
MGMQQKNTVHLILWVLKQQQLLSMQQAMTHFHTDVWSADFTVFKVLRFCANGAFGGGDDKEHEVTITAPAKDLG